MKFIKNIKMFLPSEKTFAIFVSGFGVCLILTQLTFISMGCITISRGEYKALRDAVKASESLMESIDRDYMLDVISESDECEEYDKKVELVKQYGL